MHSIDFHNYLSLQGGKKKNCPTFIWYRAINLTLTSVKIAPTFEHIFMKHT